MSLYENLTDGIIDREEYTRLKASFTARADETEKQMDALRETLTEIQNHGTENAWMNEFIKRQGLIAIGDNVDSANGSYDLTVPFLNMMNDYYARGISTKTKAAKQARAKQGMFLGSKAPYGYQKDPEDKHHLIMSR